MNKSNPGSNKPAAMFCGLLLAATSMLACEVGYKDIGDDPMGDGDGDGDPQGDGDGDGDGDPMGDGDGDPMGDGDGDPMGDGDGDGDGDPMGGACDGPAFETCAELEDAFLAETGLIRSCSENADCGQQLVGTSCGCTHDWVARVDADATCFYDLIDQSSVLECDLGLASDCDCPGADGYACVQGVCEWNYL